jgi:hypothetical protein
MNRKQNLFIFARKRKIPLEKVYQVLEQIGAIPTYKQSPTRVLYPYIGPDGFTYHELVPNDKRRKRDISEEQFKEGSKILTDMFCMKSVFGRFS